MTSAWICNRITRVWALAYVTTISLLSGTVRADETWIRPLNTSSPLTWGHREGIVFGLPSESGLPGPRGLIRVGLADKSGSHTLINFIAVEPVTKGAGDRFSRLAFSELEPSEIDAGKQGKKLWVEKVAGELCTIHGFGTTEVECLSARVMVEKFSSNGAHVYLDAGIRSDRPYELILAVSHHPDSAPIEELTVTATMGNYMRARQLWLADTIVDSRELYNGYEGVEFVEGKPYALDRLLRWQNDPVVFFTTDEENPAAVNIRSRWWNYRGPKLTQYWRVPRADVQPNLRARANGRRVYWNSERVIPGGISFENVEVRQSYEAGQVYVFGLTTLSPHDLKPPITRLPVLPVKK